MNSKSWIKPSFDDLAGSNCQKNGTGGNLNQNFVQELWSVKFMPEDLLSIAVHKKKVNEIQDWINSQTDQQTLQKSILLLVGPAGCGKTTTVKVVCKVNNVHIQEWINPVRSQSNFSHNASDVKEESQMKLFYNFLTRANKYSSLSQSGCGNKRIILIEDFPNVFYRNASEFQDIIRNFKRNAHSSIIFIITSDNKSESNDLFPKHLQDELAMSTISFNPISNTMMTKALKSTMKMAELSMKIKSASTSVIEKLVASSLGDIRSAINSLQFYCMHAKYSKRITKEKKFRKVEVAKDETFFLGRDNSLTLFRVIGKIIYCKREENKNDGSLLPDVLQNMSRNLLKFSPEDILDRCSISSECLNLFLHQNYMPFFGEINDITRASSYLSDSDYLLSDWMVKDVMEKYSSSIATRGIMHANTSIKNNGFKSMHKPEWYRVIDSRKSNEAYVKNAVIDFKNNEPGLFLEYIPFMKFLNFPDSYFCDNKEILNKICHVGFQNKNYRSIAPIDDKMQIEVSKNGEQVSENLLKSEMVLEADDPDDYLIEEFSD